MRFSSLVAVLAALCQVQKAAAWDDIILPPVYSDPSLPERLLILMPGGLVPNHHYKLTGQAIQNATVGVRLTVVVPEVFQKLCIISCTAKQECSVLKNRVDAAVAKSSFKGTNPKEDTFLAGHSLGATCASYLVQGYNYEFAGLMEFGGYVDMTGPGSIANFSIPLLHMAGEVDGGAARPSTMAGLYEQSKAYADSHSIEDALKMKPVHVLEGLDHSDFCPGFFVTKTKDCKSEVEQDAALATIGEVAAAFLHLHTPTSDATKAAAMAVMKKRLAFTLEMVQPYLTAFQLEKGQLASPPSGVPAGPWCNVAAETIVGLSTADASKLKVDACKLITTGLHDFEHQHSKHTITPDGKLDVDCFSAVEAPPKSIDALSPPRLPPFGPRYFSCSARAVLRAPEETLTIRASPYLAAAVSRSDAVSLARRKCDR